MRDLIEERCGLRFADTQRASLSASVAARMEQLGLVNEDEYFERLRGAAPTMVEAELRNLLNLVTVTETCFFRDPPQFRVLADYIIPTLISERLQRQDPSRTIRIWSAGCSTGEEAYSIAITLDQMHVDVLYPGWRFEIVATDLNTMALDRARRGVYTPRAVRNVEGRLLDRYFEQEGKTFVLNRDIARRVNFEFGNLRQTPRPSTGQQDVVFCKNVAIYFRTEATRTLIEGLSDTIAPDGYLLLGHAESLWQVTDRFDIVEHERAFFYQKAPTRLPALRDPGRTIVHGRAPAADASDATDDAANRYDFCLATMRAGEWDAAERALDALTTSCPTFVPGLLLLGGLYAHRGRFDEALGQAEAVLQVSDLEPRAHLLIGMVAARRRRPDDALLSLRRALYLDDSLALGHFWLGNLYRERGDLARACLEYENVVRGWERHTLEMTEEFASDLSAEQLVGFCSAALARLQDGER